MGTLRTGKDSCRALWLGRGSLRKCYLNPLVAQQAHAGSTMLPAIPILPEQGGRPNLKRMQQQADPARLLRVPAVPLAKLSQPTASAVTDPGCIDHAASAALFAAPFLGQELFASRTAQGPVKLLRKVLPTEAPGFPEPTDGW